MTSYVYLLHFDRPISDRHTCQHYIGKADDVEQRYRLHLAGQGARLCQVALERGIGFDVVRIWEAEPGQARQLERKLKRRKEGPALCPVCSSERKRRRWQPALWPDLDLAELPEVRF